MSSQDLDTIDEEDVNGGKSMSVALPVLLSSTDLKL